MSNGIGEKIMSVRQAEGLSRTKFAELTGISSNTQQNYEIKGREITSTNLQIITNHPQFQKYTLWLMTDQVAPEAGQISPAMESEEVRTAGAAQ